MESGNSNPNRALRSEGSEKSNRTPMRYTAQGTMILTLEVTGPQATALGAGSRAVFTTEGGVIGRARTSDWALPHAKVSSRHAMISFLDGVFYIEDRSSNGICINSSANRLARGRRYALQSGDRILIEPYDIAVSVSRTHAGPPRAGGERSDPGLLDAAGGSQEPFGIDDAFAEAVPRPTPRSVPRRDPSTPEPVPTEEVDPLKLLGGEAKRPPARRAPTAEELDRRPLGSDHFEPPAIVAPPTPPPADPFLIPEGYDPLRDDFVEPPPPAVPEPPPAAPVEEPPVSLPAASAPARITPPPEWEPPTPTHTPQPPQGQATRDDDEAPPRRDDIGALTALLSGAGLEGVAPNLELARRIGEIFRVVVSGVMDVLRSRQQVKDEFRMRMTQFRPADNNPLKFSANVDDALHNLLVKRNPAYLGPVEAFEDAFDDLRNHQLAVLAGMRVAFDTMLAEFDPDRLEKQFDRQLKRSPMLQSLARLRYWDLYRDRRDEMAKDPDTAFKKLFGEEFAKAYEEQLNRLKAESRARVADRRDSSDRR